MEWAVSMSNQTKHRSLASIAREIHQDWRNVYYGAQPYLAAMSKLDQITDMYYHDDAESVVLYFLSNASTWRGEVAKRVKAELKAICKSKR